MAELKFDVESFINNTFTKELGVTYQHIIELLKAEKENRMFIFKEPATVDDLETIRDIGRIVNNLDDINKWMK
jgi:hypothetical protein